MIKLHNKEVIFGMFPNGEAYLPLVEAEKNIKTFNYIDWVYEDDSEFFKLAMLQDHIKSKGYRSSLTIMYMPHSRMDRYNSSYAFSLKTAAKLVNNMGFYGVSVLEPHSDVTPALLEGAVTTNEWVQSHIKLALDFADQIILITKPNSHGVIESKNIFHKKEGKSNWNNNNNDFDEKLMNEYLRKTMSII